MTVSGPLDAALDAFALLDLEPGYALDAAALRGALLRESARWHPDRHALASAAEQAAAETRMTALNHAYLTLSDPLSRAGLLLARAGIDVHGRETCPLFLMDVMEMREAVDDGDPRAIDRLAAREQRSFAALEEAFRDWEAAGMDAARAANAATALTEATYLHRVLEEARRNA